jgi:hypothetical protein
MPSKTSRIAPTPKERFIKGLIMALHNETLILSESERSLYRFILDHRDDLSYGIIGRRIIKQRCWRIYGNT